jgi:hypothetical protein
VQFRNEIVLDFADVEDEFLLLVRPFVKHERYSF